MGNVWLGSGVMRNIWLRNEHGSGVNMENVWLGSDHGKCLVREWCQVAGE